MKNSSDFDYRSGLKLISRNRNLFTVMALAILAAVIAVCYMMPSRYEARSTVFIEKSVISELVKGIAITPSLEDKVKVLAYTIKSRPLLMKVFDDLELNVAGMSDSRREAMIREFQEKTDIKLKDQQGLFIISFTSGDPRLARDYVNALTRRYIEENLSSKREDSYGAARFFEEQLASLRTRLEESEEKVTTYRKSHGDLLGQNEGALLAEISAARQRIEEYAARRQQIENQLTVARNNDPLQSKLAALLVRQQELSLVYTDQHPELTAIAAEIASVRESMGSGRARQAVDQSQPPEIQRLTLEAAAVREQEAGQRRLIASKQAALRGIPGAKTGLDELERERNGQKYLYEQLAARHGQSEMTRQIEVQDKSATFRIVDPAVLPTRPVSPQRLRIILFGLLGSLAGSLAILLLREQMDSSIRTPDALKALGVPLLAIVPDIETEERKQAARRSDLWFYAAAGSYATAITAAISLEVMREYSLDPVAGVAVIRSLTSLAGTIAGQ